MTTRIREFLKHRTDNGPCLVVDLDVVRENYQNFAKALPDTKVFYAVKANPAPEILKLLAGLGCCFDVASLTETQQVLAAGATPDRISYGNTIKKESEIAEAFRLGVTLFAVDCEAEVEKVARAAPGSRVICRIHCDGSGAEWPLSRKFGCEPAYAADILELAHKQRAGAARHLVPCRLAAAQCRSLGPGAGLRGRGLPHLRRARHRAVDRQSRRRLPGQLRAQDAEARILRQGDLQGAAQAFRQQPAEHHRRARPRPRRQCRRHRGRGGADRQAPPEDEVRWVYLDIGKFHGLAETIGELIRYPIRTTHDRDETAPCIIAGPTCDSVDVLYEKTPYPLPVSLAIGDKVLIEAAGAYTATYSSVGFNGYPPLRQYVI